MEGMADRGGAPESRIPERVERAAPDEAEHAFVGPEIEREARSEVVEALENEAELPAASPAPFVPAARPKSVDAGAAYLPDVQRILASGLYETYAQLPPALQQKLKVEGEATASRIAVLLTEVKVQVSKIIRLIQRWLSLIPGVNRYYLEQEAKLKADALLALREERSGA
jgi:hypothetical protein